MRNFSFVVLALGVAASTCLLAGCGGSSYGVLSRNETTTSVSYELEVERGLLPGEASTIASEVGGKETKETFVIMYDGPRDPANIIYGCTAGECTMVTTGRGN